LWIVFCPLAAFSRGFKSYTARSGRATWLRSVLEMNDWERLAINKKGSRERDPCALSPSIRFRRGGIGPPREEETADYYNARPMPQQPSNFIRTLSDESNGFTPIQSSIIASAYNRPLRFLTIFTMRLHSLEYSQAAFIAKGASVLQFFGPPHQSGRPY
jgi:hypothetical protein